MTKALTTFVLLNLAASVAIVALGTLTFMDRKALKAEALELESTAQAITDNLRWGQDVAWETPEEKKPLEFDLPESASADDLNDLDAALENMVRFTNQRQSQLSLRHNELVTTRETLVQVREAPMKQKRELEALKNKPDQLQRSLAEAKNELQKLEPQLAEAKSNRTEYNNKISDLNDSITNLNNQLATLEIDLETRIQERNLAKEEYDKCRYGTGEDAAQIRGKRGKVLAVNDDWEYVVIDKGMVHNVETDREAFVHRGKDYIGKLKVIRVQDNIALAEIVPGTVKETDSIKAGDILFF